MPGLVRRVLIFAAVDGLILQPAPPRNHKPATEQAIKLDYRTNFISSLDKDRRDEDTAPHALDAHGIVGLLRISSSSFLISITGREQVAQIRGKPIYSISDVALIPLSSQSDAEQAITRARQSQQRHARALAAGESEFSSGESSEDEAAELPVSEQPSLPSSPPPEPEPEHELSGAGPPKRKTSIAEDVISRKGMYGRFAQRWFSKKGWSTESRRNQGMSNNDEEVGAATQEEVIGENKMGSTGKVTNQDEMKPVPKSNDKITPSNESHGEVPNKLPEEVSHVQQTSAEENRITLLPKVLTVTKLFFASKSFYFSYDYDLSRSLSSQPDTPTSLPLHRTFDTLFFWNRNLISPFIDAGQHSFVMPLIQGFVGQRAFSVDKSKNGGSAIISSTSSAGEIPAAEDDTDLALPTAKAATTGAEQQPPDSSNQNEVKDFLLTIVSRRSIKRAGLRYLRRGVDEDGNVANSVETEQILSAPDWNSQASKIYSFVQYRGSIPLLFSQSPYSLKPVVVFQGSPETNASAFRLHFRQLAARYGNVQVASLVEKKGNEAKLGEAFEKQATALNKSGGIDGNGNELNFEWFDFHGECRGMKFENVSRLFDKIGPQLLNYGWTEEQGGKVSKAQRGVLRTNCMDCLDRTNVVQSACARNILEQQLQEEGITIDLQSDPSTSWFNTVWADNGDAISRQYAGTSALKGDFTRTRKRNISGALTDFGLTLTRYVKNIRDDWFTQAVIDYILGLTDETSFIDFEADMQTKDYAVDLRKVRENAIDTCVKICVESNEDLVAGWTLSCPHQSNTLRSLPFEECVLLLTEQALYFCRMDWATEKVKEFERVELASIDAVARGVYITSTLAQRNLDEQRNVGFVLRISGRGRDVVRVNTRSLASEKDDGEDKVALEAVSDDNNSQKDAGGKKKAKPGQQQQQAQPDRILAFKALPPKSSFVGSGAAQEGDAQPPSELDLIRLVTDQIVRVANAARQGKSAAAAVQEAAAVQQQQSSDAAQSHDDDAADEQGREGRLLAVEEKDIISLTDAKRSTGYIEQLGYSLKKLVWA